MSVGKQAKSIKNLDLCKLVNSKILGQLDLQDLPIFLQFVD